MGAAGVADSDAFDQTAAMWQGLDWAQPRFGPQVPVWWGRTVRNKTTIAGLALLAAVAIGCGSGSEDTQGPGSQGGDDKSSTASAKNDGKKKVVMEVSGPKSADITFGLGTDQSQENGAKLPWKKELTSGEAMIIPTIVAQSKGSGKITCKITIDGKLAKENSSSGEFAVVTCTADNF